MQPDQVFRKRSTSLQNVLAYLLIMIIVALAIHKREDFWNTFQQIEIAWAVTGLICYYLNYLMRALRLNALSFGRIQLWPHSVRIVGIHGISTYLLPMRLGDVSLPLLVQSHSRLFIQDGVRILFQARLLDVFSLGIWILISAVFLSNRVIPSIKLFWVGAGVLMVLSPPLIRLMGGWMASSRFNLLKRISAGASFASFSLAQVIFSILIWFLVGGVFFSTVKAIGLPLNLSDTWFLITIQLPLQLMPIQGIANAGNHEGGWILGLTLLGIKPGIGLNYALASHALLLSYVLLLGPMVLIAGQRRFSR